MKKYLFLLAIISVFALIGKAAYASKPDTSGFDEFGYNTTARIFNGTCLSWHQGKFGSSVAEAAAYCEDYTNDKLIMKWNAEWDRGNDEDWANPPYFAWENNQWNGMKDGSGEVWHYKIAWVGPCTEGTDFEDGGYCIWGQFKVLSDHGKDSTGHTTLAHAIPNGYGAYKYEQVDSFVVPANSLTGTNSSVTLENEKNYLIKVSGVADAGDTIDFDAEYSVTKRLDPINWTDGVNGYLSEGADLLDLMIDSEFVDWGDLDEVSHTYFVFKGGTGDLVNLKVNDIFPSNNTGEFSVTIYMQK